MMKADFFYRALPWSELSLRSGRMPNDLNLHISQRISVALVFILCSLAAYSTLRWRAYFLTPLITTFSILLSYYWLEKQGSWIGKTLIVANTVLIVGFSYWFHMFAIIPMVLIACLALFVRHRYASSSGASWQRRTRWVVGGYLLFVAGMVWIYFPWTPIGCTFLLLMVTLLVLNKQFYVFLAGSNRGRLFAICAIPFHMLYFASSALAFTIALARHGLIRLRRSTAEADRGGGAAEETTARISAR